MHISIYTWTQSYLVDGETLSTQFVVPLGNKTTSQDIDRIGGLEDPQRFVEKTAAKNCGKMQSLLTLLTHHQSRREKVSKASLLRVWSGGRVMHEHSV